MGVPLVASGASLPALAADIRWGTLDPALTLTFQAMNLTERGLRPTGRDPVSVAMVDSGVAFLHGLKTVGAGQHDHTRGNNPAPDPQRDMPASFDWTHGTRLASIIASHKVTLSMGNFVGVYPLARIVNRKTAPALANSTYVADALDASSQVTGAPGLEKIINVATRDTWDGERWKRLLHRIGDAQRQVIVASVGNAQVDLNASGDSVPFWPGGYRPVTPGEKANDPVVRVTMANFLMGAPQVMGSYGKGRVDIAAPGFAAASVGPNGQVSYTGGTSEATALVSGVLAAMASCDATATTRQLKAALLDSADKVASLADEVTDGRVLNADRAIATACKQAKARRAALLLIHDKSQLPDGDRHADEL